MYKMYVNVISICVRSVALLLLHVKYQPGCVLWWEELSEVIFVEIVLCSLRFQYLTICRWK